MNEWEEKVLKNADGLAESGVFDKIVKSAYKRGGCMKAKYEEKFIVINEKRFDEILESVKNENKYDKLYAEGVIKHFLGSLELLNYWYKTFTGKELDQKYYVCNQDEPYAQEVIDIILRGESNKIKEDV